MFAVRGYPTGWFVVPEIEENKVNFKDLALGLRCWRSIVDRWSKQNFE